MDIFVCEFVSGGGLSSELVSSSLFSEAFAILRVLGCTFDQCGDQVFSLLDERIAPVAEILPAEIVTITSIDDYYEGLRRFASKADLVVCVAPETNGFLARCTNIIEKAAPNKLIGCTEPFVELAGNKMETAIHCKSLKLPIPDTYHVKADEAEEILRENTSTFVAKPIDGVGAEGVVLLTNPSDLDTAKQRLPYLDRSKFILQEFVYGIHGSLSFICGEVPFLLTANRQFTRINNRTGFLEYHGGETPWQHSQIAAVTRTAKKFLENTSGARGWVGFDILVNSNNHWLIECNPRITSSIVGAWTLDPIGPAINLKAIFDMESYRNIPPGHAIFKVISLESTESWDETLQLMETPGIVSPPFPFQDLTSMVLTAKGNTRNEAQQCIMRIEKELETLNSIDDDE